MTILELFKLYKISCTKSWKKFLSVSTLAFSCIHVNRTAFYQAKCGLSADNYNLTPFDAKHSEFNDFRLSDL